MTYLSKDLEVAAKRKKRSEKSLIKKQYSCGIFQDYGDTIPSSSKTSNENGEV